MNYTETFFSAANTILLIILFLYQRNRNKVLGDQLVAQKQLLDETKSVVTQQASAIEGQSRVVDTALKYTSAFDPKKLEELIRREVSLEHREHLEQAKIDAKSSARPRSAEANQIITTVTDVAVQVATEATVDLLKPLLPLAVQAIIHIPEVERRKVLESVAPELRDFLLDATAEIEKRVQDVLRS